MKRSKLLTVALLGAFACGEPSVTPIDGGPKPDLGVPDAGFVGLDGSTNCGADREQCGSLCVDANSDPMHCGMCFETCEANEFCNNGSCGRSCNTPLTGCGQSCVDLASDPNHCGRCDRACPSDQVCNGGDCECAPGTLDCGGVCVDTDTDRNNCGLCTRTCDADEVCMGGSCECAMGNLKCEDGTCVDDKTDPNNCGLCGRVCDTDEFCNDGTCTCKGGDRETDCNDTMDDDCDDLVDCADPDCIGVTRSCEAGGAGTCSTGVETCQADTNWSTCVVGNNEPEICGDGIDQDCMDGDERAPDQYEPNDSCSECYQIPGTDPMNLVLAPSPSFDSVNDNVDCFKFDGHDSSNPLSREYIEISVTDIPVGHDYDVYLYRNFTECEARTPLGASTNIGNAEESISWAESFGTDDNSTYYVRVRRYDGYSCTESYTLRINGLN